MQTLTSRRENWRKLVKKLQRKRRRQKLAKERDKELENAKQDDPLSAEMQLQQSELEIKALEEQRRHDDEEADWLRRELIAQQQFRMEQERRRATEAAKEAIRLQQEKELEEREAAQKKQLEEKKRLSAEAAYEFEALMKKMDKYLSDLDMKTPRELKRFVDTKPDQKLCEFYQRTNCCRFGVRCTFNHRRPLLGRILLIHHFFSHPLLEPLEKSGYAVADAHVETTEHDLRDDYDAFFHDVLPELESFGKIKSFCTLRNILPHLRGNVFVEYEDKRSALRAFISLQGRFYAMKPLTVEFSNLLTWRGAVCGLSLIRKCSRGFKCSYLHLFKNPGNKYNCVLENTKYLQGKTKNTGVSFSEGALQSSTSVLSWNDVCSTDRIDNTRNWRWSESPAKEVFLNVNESNSDEMNNGSFSEELSQNKEHSIDCSSTQKERNQPLEPEPVRSKSEELIKQKKREPLKKKYKSKKSKHNKSPKCNEDRDKKRSLKKKHKSHTKKKKKSKKRQCVQLK